MIRDALRRLVAFMVGEAAMPRHQDSSTPLGPLAPPDVTTQSGTANFGEQIKSGIEALTDAATQVSGSMDMGESFEPIQPPDNLFESVIESMSRFASRIAAIIIPEGITATQAVVERIFGQPKNEESSPRTISEAVQISGERGLLNRQLNEPTTSGRFARVVGLSRPGRWLASRRREESRVAQPNPNLIVQPPESRFERVVEAVASSITRLIGIRVPEQLTATHTMRGFTPTARNIPQTITEAILPGSVGRNVVNRRRLRRDAAQFRANQRDRFTPDPAVSAVQPPQGIFERVVESMSQGWAKLTRINVPRGKTATETVFSLNETEGRRQSITERLLPRFLQRTIGRNRGTGRTDRRRRRLPFPSSPLPASRAPAETTLEPPRNFRERFVESIFRTTSRATRTPIENGRTATQTMIERVFGRTRGQESAPQTISEAVRVSGQGGLLDRRLNRPGLFGRTAARVGRSGIGQAMAGRAGGTTAATGSGMLATTGMAAGLGLIGVVVATTGILRQLGNTAWRSVNAIAKWNGVLLGSQLRLEVGRRQRMINSGFELQDEGQQRFEAQDRFEQAMHPFKTALERFGLKIETLALNTASEAIRDPMKTIVDGMIPDAILQAIGVDPAADENVVEKFRELPDGLKAALEQLFPVVGLLEKLAEFQEEEREERFKRDPMSADPLAFHHFLTEKAFPGNVPKPIRPIGEN